MKKYVIDKGCKLCDACIWACPEQAISSDTYQACIDQAKCVHCGICMENCPNEAISMYESDAKQEESK